MTEHFSLLLLCFSVALGVNYIAHRAKGVQRKAYGMTVIGLLSGFASFVLSLLIATQYSVHWAALGGGVSVFYSYFMANAKIFESFRKKGSCSEGEF